MTQTLSASTSASARPRVKICGVRTIEEAKAAESAGADWVGLNFVPDSRRRITLEDAATIVSALTHAEPVGLFVNVSTNQIRDSLSSIGVRIVQLHGEEPPEAIAELGDFRVVKAFRLGHLSHLNNIVEFWSRSEALGAPPYASLIDAWVPQQRGGAGVLIANEWLGRLPSLPRLILAGGLTPLNVANQIAKASVRPWMVDTASGVESAPGVKCENLMRDFVQSVRNCDNIAGPQSS